MCPADFCCANAWPPLAAQLLLAKACRSAVAVCMQTAASSSPVLTSFGPADSPAIRAALGVAPGASNEEAFGAIRSAKDNFR